MNDQSFKMSKTLYAKLLFENLVISISIRLFGSVLWKSDPNFSAYIVTEPFWKSGSNRVCDTLDYLALSLVPYTRLIYLFLMHAIGGYLHCFIHLYVVALPYFVYYCFWGWLV